MKKDTKAGQTLQKLQFVELEPAPNHVDEPEDDHVITIGMIIDSILSGMQEQIDSLEERLLQLESHK